MATNESLIAIAFPTNPRKGYLTKSMSSDGVRLIEYSYHHDQNNNKVLIVSHGMTGSLNEVNYQRWQEFSIRTSISVMQHNYPTCGNTSGPRTEQTIVNDLCTIVKWLKDKGWRDEDIALLGISAGCGPTIASAARVGAQTVILISPYTDCKDFLFRVTEWYNMPTLVMAMIMQIPAFSSLELVRSLKNKRILFIHGSADVIIPQSKSELLFRAVNDADGSSEKAHSPHHHLQGKNNKPLGIEELEGFERYHGGSPGFEDVCKGLNDILLGELGDDALKPDTVIGLSEPTQFRQDMGPSKMQQLQGFLAGIPHPSESAQLMKLLRGLSSKHQRVLMQGISHKHAKLYSEDLFAYFIKEQMVACWLERKKLELHDSDEML